ncbi:hypothetical protein M91_06940 [Bos mutus]|uniref:Uncharacterized protein n=1 Tax=Bos mutus TaxID=72004 RepID=L8HZP3_9CETA|nr:hypothetical protein M91_06940 [Bos mutus]
MPHLGPDAGTARRCNLRLATGIPQFQEEKGFPSRILDIVNQKKRLRDVDIDKQPCDSDVTSPLMPLNWGSTVPANPHGNAQHSGPCDRQVPLKWYSDTLYTPAPKTPMGFLCYHLSLYSSHSGCLCTQDYMLLQLNAPQLYGAGPHCSDSRFPEDFESILG